MTTHGPFHSLSDTDKQALTDQLHQGVSVLRAAGVLDLNYGHALNYAHTLGFGHRRQARLCYESRFSQYRITAS